MGYKGIFEVVNNLIKKNEIKDSEYNRYDRDNYDMILENELLKNVNIHGGKFLSLKKKDIDGNLLIDGVRNSYMKLELGEVRGDIIIKDCKFLNRLKINVDKIGGKIVVKYCNKLEYMIITVGNECDVDIYRCKINDYDVVREGGKVIYVGVMR